MNWDRKRMSYTFVVVSLGIAIVIFCFDCWKWRSHVYTGTVTEVSDLPMGVELVAKLSPIGLMRYRQAIGYKVYRLSVSGKMLANDYESLLKSQPIHYGGPIASDEQTRESLKYLADDGLVFDFHGGTRHSWQFQGWDVNLYYRNSDGIFTIEITGYGPYKNNK